MARLVKFLLALVVAIVGIGVLASIALFLFFDPNDFKDDISEAVAEETGRELVLGEISLSIFPWIAVEVGQTSLGNAEGFSDQPMLSFDQARLSVRLVPLIFKQEVAVGTAELASLRVNLETNEDGRSNWDDLGGDDAGAEPAAEAPADADAGAGQVAAESGAPALNIGNISVTDAQISIIDRQAGTTTTVSDLNFETGHIAAGTDFDINAGFALLMQPDGTSGTLSMSGNIALSEDMSTVDVTGLRVSGELAGVTPQPSDFNLESRAISIDTNNEQIALGELDLSVVGVSMAMNISPFSYAGDPQPSMELRVNEFSLTELMQRLGQEPPETADPNALQRVAFTGRAVVGASAVALSDLQLQLDDTTMTGELSLPRAENGMLRFDLNVDSINADAYMAPADPDAVEEDTAAAGDVEIPVELIRALNASGSFRIGTAWFAGIPFSNMELGLNAEAGNVRLHPIAAEMFEGRYRGDVRIDARGDEPMLSVNENIEDVKLGALAKTLYDVDNITGEIEGSFVLNSRGADSATLVRNLNGNMSFVLADGEWQGTDIWYQLRRARAALRQETPPEPELPARTEFSEVSVSGQVTNGVLQSNDLLAELPFMRLSGRGKANMVDATVDYRLDARVADSPELRGELTAEEVEDFTKVVVPIVISGPMAAPGINVDLEGLAKQELKKEADKLKDRLIDKLLKRGNDDDSEGARP